MQLQLKISGFHHNLLMQHLLPADGKEAVAVALCGRMMDHDAEILLVHDVTLIPYNECYSREYDLLQWPTERIAPYFEKIGKSDLAILKIHSHPGGYREFSRTDDTSDHEFFDSVFGWSINDKPHASAVMLPEGEIFGRFFYKDLSFQPIDKVVVAGDVIKKYAHSNDMIDSDFALRTIQAFGEKTYVFLKTLTIGVVGCSGTGSPVIEQLARLGVGKLVLVDPDLVEKKNVNRILNSTMNDAILERPKVSIISDAIKKIGLCTEIETHQANLYHDVSTLRALAKCDIIFGCMDSVDGRHILNQLCSFYLIPYFDLGVKLQADGRGGITQICGSVHYIQPCKSSLIKRRIYTMDDLRAASQYRKNPEEYNHLMKNGYISNVNVNNPAVVSVNMQVASHAVNEFLNRIHPFKSESPSMFAASTIEISAGYIVNSDESDFELDAYLLKKSGRGDMQPFIEMSELVE